MVYVHYPITWTSMDALGNESADHEAYLVIEGTQTLI